MTAEQRLQLHACLDQLHKAQTDNERFKVLDKIFELELPTLIGSTRLFQWLECPQAESLVTRWNLDRLHGVLDSLH